MLTETLVLTLCLNTANYGGDPCYKAAESYYDYNKDLQNVAHNLEKEFKDYTIYLSAAKIVYEQKFSIPLTRQFRMEFNKGNGGLIYDFKF